MLLKNKSFQINDYIIPTFTLAKGEMIRFWVETIPIVGDNNNDWGTHKMEEVIHFLNQKSKTIKKCPNKIKRSVVDYLTPISTGKYLQQKFGFSAKEIEITLSSFGIKPAYKIKDLGAKHQKIFSIICAFQKNEIVAYDYYGLAPNTEKRLTAFVKNEIAKGKAAISFDHLHYKPEKSDTEKIINLEIRRHGTTSSLHSLKNKSIY